MSVSPDPSAKDQRQRRQAWIAGATGLTVLVMLGMSFAAVPLYRLFCATTGYAGTTQVAKQAPATRGQRDMIVRFDANVGPGLRWSFSPDILQIKLRTGETATMFFKVTNQTNSETAAQAMYNVTPDVAGAYFDKISCFCFTEQKLGPHETADMPVVFFLDPKLEADATMNGIESVTLSYTFYPSKSSNPVATKAMVGSAKPAL
ncbi:MAG: cytochrome c oxidase assembly protein [Beijerinckiaceae bacterium]